MTDLSLAVKARMQSGTIVPLLEEAPYITTFKTRFRDGDEFRLTFEPWRELRSDEHMRYWYALRDRYADAKELDRFYAKCELKYHWGVAIPITDAAWFVAHPPKKAGVIVEIYGEHVYLVSLNEYTRTQMHNLVEKTKDACAEAGADISDLEADYRRLPK